MVGLAPVIGLEAPGIAPLFLERGPSGYDKELFQADQSKGSRQQGDHRTWIALVGGVIGRREQGRQRLVARLRLG
jgi:hypothetical protein